MLADVCVRAYADWVGLDQTGQLAGAGKGRRRIGLEYVRKSVRFFGRWDGLNPRGQGVCSGPGAGVGGVVQLPARDRA